MARNKRTQRKKKLEMLKKLRTCTVVLTDIAKDTNLISLYRLHLPIKEEKYLKQSPSYIDTPKNSNSTQLEENVQKKTPLQKQRCTKRSSKKVTKKKNNKKRYKVEAQLYNENIQNKDKISKDISLDGQCDKVIRPNITVSQQLIYDSNIESLSSKNNDQTSSISTYICSAQEIPVSTNNKTHRNVRKSNIRKKRIPMSKTKRFNKPTYDTSTESIKVDPDVNYLDKKNLTFVDYNSEMQEVSDESVLQYGINVPFDITNQTESKLRQEQRKKSQDSKVVSLNIINTELNKLSLNGIAENVMTNGESIDSNFSDNILTHIYENKIYKRQDQQDTRAKSANKITLVDNAAQTINISNSFSDLKSIYPTITSKANNVTVMLSDFLKTCNEEKPVNNKANNSIKHSLPKITSNDVFPKGRIKIVKVNRTNNSLQNDVLKQSRCNDTNRNRKKTLHIDDTVESTNIILEGKEYHTSPEINGSNDIFKIPKSTLTLNNNNLKNKHISSNEFHDKVTVHRNLNSLTKISNIRNDIYINDNNETTNSETTIRCEDYILDQQEQAIRLDNNGDKHESVLLQNNRKYEKINCNENTLDQNISNFMDTGKNYISRPLISISKEEAIKQTRKRTAEESAKDLNLSGNKKIKLNRNSWLQNNASFNNSRNHQQFNNFPSTDTTLTQANSNIMSNDEDNSSNEGKTDLREHLNQKRSKLTDRLEPTFESTYDNRNSTISEEIIIDNKTDAVNTINTTENMGLCNKLSVEERSTLKGNLYKEEDNAQVDSIYDDDLYSQSPLEETQNVDQIDANNQENINVQEELRNETTDDKYDDDDCISLFANESFDVTIGEDTFLHEENQLCRPTNFDVPHVMTNSSFDKYMKQNTNEFNMEYAECIKNNVEITLSEPNERKEKHNNHSKQTLHTDCVPATATGLTTLKVENATIWSKEKKIGTFINGYCFTTLKLNTCYKLCRFKHNLQDLISKIYSEDPETIAELIQSALKMNYYFFSEKMYMASLNKLTVDQILIIYLKFHNNDLRSTISKKYIIHNIIRELFNRQLSLKMIVDRLVTYIVPTKNLQELENVLMSVERYIKPGEYWNTVRNLILELQPNKCFTHIIQRVLLECINTEELFNIQDVKENLINRLHPSVISTLDKHIVERFKRLLAEKIAENSPAMSVQNFGESLTTVGTIASPDSNQSTRLSQTESLRRYDIAGTEIDANKIEKHTQEINLMKSYVMQPIDDLPDARSIYRNHKNLWKFYVDLDRFKKGLEHNDYDYVISILKSYAENQDESTLYFRSCRNILQTEVKRSEYHLANIIHRTVQTSTFDVLGKILLDMTLDILVSLMDKEAWGLALWLIQSLNAYDLSCNAEFFLLSAEIYLANKKAVEAYDLLKNKNVISTNRAKWHVKSTINDEHVRNKIIYILLDALSDEFLEHAFFLFQFLLKDQSSQYFPIDLSRYVDKFVMLSLLRKDKSLITEMSNLVLKHNFALSTITCRALISTLIHLDEALTRQIYNYAEGIGVYPREKLWPVTYIVISNDLTEEEIYLIFLQLLKTLLINFGHAIEFAKPHQIKVYFILEIKSTNEQFYCAELQSHYNSQAISNAKTLIRSVLNKRFDPPITIMRSSKGRIYRLQSKSLINYLKSEHCN